MRECHGLVDSMIHYVNSSLEVGKSEDKVSPGCCEGLGALRRAAAPALLGHLAITAQSHLSMWWWENQPGSVWARWVQRVSWG